MTQYDNAALAAQYSSKERFDHPMSRMQYDTWLRILGDVRGKKILDLACGSGYCSRLLAQKGAIVTGVDIASEMIKIAQTEETRAPMGIRYLLGDAAAFDLHELFDCVTPTYLLHYAESEDRLGAFTRGIARHLKAGGRMVALHAGVDPVVPFLPNAQSSSEWAIPLLAGEQPKEGSQVNLHLYDVNGKEVCPVITYYYWTKQTYVRNLLLAGLIDPTWVKVEMPEEVREIFPNWRDLDRLNTSCVLTATKI